MSNRVYVQLTKFTDINPDLSEIASALGYRIYDDYSQMYNNFLSEDEVKDFGPKEALNAIKEFDSTENGAGILESVTNKESFYFNDERIEVIVGEDGSVEVKE